MSELEDRINAVLSDPEQLSRLSEMAKSIMGGGAAESPLPPSAGAAEAEGGPPGGDALASLGALLRGGLGKSERIAALEALMPCLSEKRRAKLGRAIALAKAARAAGLAAGGIDGGLL